MTTKTITPKSSSILAEAMDVLLQHLGPQKTAELWQVISAPDGDYLKIRKQLFAGKDVHAIFTEAKRFNRKKECVPPFTHPVTQRVAGLSR